MSKKARIYLDYAATTPVDPRVVKEMQPYLSEKFGNTMSWHSFGQEAEEALQKSRQMISDSIGADPSEVIFTGSATESNNLVLKGVALANKNKGRHIIISPIEHPCVMKSAKFLERQGFEITRLPVNGYGLINPKEVAKTIRKDTILVSIIHASNEIGTLQAVAEIGQICRSKGVYFHTDAVQSFGKMPINVNKMKVDLLSASSHKIYGPKGAALLYVRKGTVIEPLLHGGGQEFGLRSSTVNVAGIVGFAKACQLEQKEMKRESVRIIKLRDRLIRGALKNIPGSYLNGHPTKRLINNANFRFDGVEGEAIMVQLDLAGIAVSTGSACSSSNLEPSHVLLAIGLKHQQAHSSLRVSLGRWTKREEIDYLLKVLPDIINNLRRISGNL